jgi:hypothetical protein
MLKLAWISCTTLFAGLALAHDGHGFTGAHLHASDMFGFTMAALAIGALAVWRSRK